MADATRLKCTVYVGGLENSITKQVLQEAFLPFGEIISVNLPSSKDDDQHRRDRDQDWGRDRARCGAGGGGDKENDSHRGFGYVEFDSPEDALAAIDNMDQAVLAGRVLSVAQAKPQKEVGNVIGSKVAVWEQEDWIRKHEVSEEDKAAADQAKIDGMKETMDPMVGLEGLDIAGPKLEE